MAKKLDSIRKELNKFDEVIKILITLRMALIPIVTDIKIKNSLPLFQSKREDEIYKKIEIFSKSNGIDENILKGVYKLIISSALRIEGSIVENPESSVISQDQIDLNFETLSESFQKLDTILSETIPSIVMEIINSTELKGMTLTDKATLYYNEKTNKS